MRFRPPVTLAALAALAGACLPAAATAAEPQVPSERVLFEDGHEGRRMLDGPWHFRLDSANEGLAARWQDEASLEEWDEVAIPHAWNSADLSDESQAGGVGWYRTDFLAPEAAASVAWKIRFESVNYRAQVWLNGEPVATNEFAYVPFETQARALKQGEANRLVVRVDSRRDATDVPAARLQRSGRPGGGWWNDGGILREVYLRPVDTIDLKEVLARPSLHCRACDARVMLRAKVVNPTRRTRRVTLRGRVGGAPVRFPALRISAGSTRTATGSVLLRNPRLWEPGSPVRYPVRVSAVHGGRTVGVHRAHTGIRSIKVDKNGRMRLNGRAVKLRGASMHEDRLGNGAALTAQQIDENWRDLRALNANVTRAHYPLHPRTIEHADRDGVLVWEQIPFNRERFHVNNETQLRDDEVLRLELVRRRGYSYMKRAIARDQNHPSVFAWSIGNELEQRPSPEIRTYIGEASKRVRAQDPTRLVALDIAGYPHLPRFETLRRNLDAIGINSYFGWYAGPRGRVSDRTGLGPYLDKLHRQYRRQALFMTEFGAEAGFSGPGDQKGTYEFQQALLRYHLGRYDRRPFINGAIVWILRDFRVQPGWSGGNPTPDPPWNQKGLIDRWGNRKPAFDDLARRYAATPPLR